MTDEVIINKEEVFAETEMWLDHLRSMGRKEGTLRTYRNNIHRCIITLIEGCRPFNASDISNDDIMFLWMNLKVKEEVRRCYLRSLSLMICYHTGYDVVRQTNLLHNRESRNRVFIDDDQFRTAYLAADPMQRVILCLGAFMGLRRCEMTAIRDPDIHNGVLTIHGKGHGVDGLLARMSMPLPVMESIQAYRSSMMKEGCKLDDRLLQSRDHQGRLHGINPSRISDTVCNLGRECGFRMTTHSLRRYYATTVYYRTNSDLQTLREMLRHADVATTLKCYVETYEQRSAEASRELTDYLSDIISDKQN